MKDEDYDYSDMTGYMYDVDVMHDAKVLSHDEMQSLMDQMTEGFAKGSVGQSYNEVKEDEQ